MPVHFFRQSTSDKLLTVDCEPNLNILAHAQLEELDIGSLCGGHGRCGGDRVLVGRGSSAGKLHSTGTAHSTVSGSSLDAALSPITDAERRHLSADEIKQGWRLGCQCWPEDPSAEIDVYVPI